MAPAKLDFTVEGAEIEVLADLIGQDLPFRRDGRWWKATAIRHSQNGMRVWAVESAPPVCSKSMCDKPATKLMTLTDALLGVKKSAYRCGSCAAGDQRIVPKVYPGTRVDLADLETA